MAIDPRISLAVQGPSLAPGSQVINTFQNALNQAQNRRAGEQRFAQNEITNPINAQILQEQANQAPIQSQLLQQQATAGQQTADVGIENRTMQLLAEQGNLIRPVLESGNTEQAIVMFNGLKEKLVAANLPTQGTDRIIQQLQSGDSQGVLNAIDAVQQNAKGRGLLGTGGAVQSSQFIPGIGFATLSKSGEAGLVTVEGVGETIAEKREADIEKSATIETTKSELSSVAAAKKLAVTKSGKAFDKLANIDVAIANFDDAIKAIDEGAQTGAIVSFLPSFRRSSIELDNIQKALGLDVVSNTTFGALSESELAFALSKALPKNLQPQDLKKWLQSKKIVQQKLRDHISNAAQFLGTGENTIPDWIELQKAQSIIREQEQTATPIAAQPTTTPTSQRGEGVIMTDANGNRARVFEDGTFEEL